MQPVFRAVRQAPRISLLARPTSGFLQFRRAAHSSYGNEQSGQEQGTYQVNPKSHLEHPGPESPASKASSSSGSSQPQSSSDPTHTQKSKPAIHHPSSSAEKDDPEVRKHNQELRSRHEQSHNQLEEDNKVDKNFWKGDVGDANQDKS